MNKKNVGRVALTGGIIWGLTLFLTTLVSVSTGYAHDFLMTWGSIYPGYTISMGGSVAGLIYGFLDLYIGIYIIYWVYGLLK